MRQDARYKYEDCKNYLPKAVKYRQTRVSIFILFETVHFKGVAGIM